MWINVLSENDKNDHGGTGNIFYGAREGPFEPMIQQHDKRVPWFQKGEHDVHHSRSRGREFTETSIEWSAWRTCMDEQICLCWHGRMGIMEVRRTTRTIRGEGLMGRSVIEHNARPCSIQRCTMVMKVGRFPVHLAPCLPKIRFVQLQSWTRKTKKKTVKGTSASNFLQDHSAAVVFPHGDTTSGGLSLVFLVVGHVAHLTLSFSASLSEFITASRCHRTPTFSCSCARASSCSAATVLQVRERGLVTLLWKAVRRSAALQVTSSLTFWSARGPNEAVVWADVVAVACSHVPRTRFPSMSPWTIRFSIENNIISSVFRGKRYKIEVPSAEPPRTAEQRPELRNLRRKLEQSATWISSRIPARCMQRARPRHQKRFVHCDDGRQGAALIWATAFRASQNCISVFFLSGRQFSWCPMRYIFSARWRLAWQWCIGVEGNFQHKKLFTRLCAPSAWPDTFRGMFLSVFLAIAVIELVCLGRVWVWHGRRVLALCVTSWGNGLQCWCCDTSIVWWHSSEKFVCICVCAERLCLFLCRWGWWQESQFFLPVRVCCGVPQFGAVETALQKAALATRHSRSIVELNHNVNTGDNLMFFDVQGLHVAGRT